MSKILQITVERGYQDFLSLVAENRNMSIEQVDAVAQGRVWSGMKAQELGLVDELGDLDDAVVLAAELAKLSHYDTLLIEKEFSPQDRLLQSLFGQAVQFFPPKQSTDLGDFDKILLKLKQEYQTINQFNDPQGIYSFCLACEVN